VISRCRGKTFPVPGADDPARYPGEHESVGAAKTSVCFWYSHALDAGSTCSSVVILRDPGLNYAGLFRLIETAADLSAAQRANPRRPLTFCEPVNDSLQELAC